MSSKLNENTVQFFCMAYAGSIRILEASSKVKVSHIPLNFVIDKRLFAGALDA
jgi:hypothetical protein